MYVKLLPSFLFIVFGYLGSRYLHVQKETLARILIYILSPAVTLLGAWVAPLDHGNLYLPLVCFGISSFVCILVYKGAWWVPKPKRNLLAYASACCNSGYFGLPLAVALLGEEAFARAVLISMGFFFFENTLGFYVSARGKFSIRESLKRLFRLPYIYAFALGLFLNFFGVERMDILGAEVLPQTRGAYSVLGMMLVGVGIGMATHNFAVLLRDSFTSSVMLIKFLLLPFLMSLLVIVDSYFLAFSVEAKVSLMLASFLPIAANTVAFATELKLVPDLAAIGVTLSTLFSLLFYPLVWPYVEAWVRNFGNQS